MLLIFRDFIQLGLLFFVGLTVGITVGCSGSRSYDGITAAATPTPTPTPTSYSGNLIVTSITTEPSTGPGLASMWSTSGTFISNLRDLFSTGEWSSGSAFVSPDQILLLIANGTRIENLNLTTTANTNFYVGVRLNGTPNRSMVRSTVDGSIYVAEQTTNNIEKFDSAGNPSGAPFIGTTVGSCTLATPMGMAFISNTENIAVLNTARLNIYTKDGACSTTVTTAPFSTNAPSAIAYHPTYDSLIVTFATNHAIYACSAAGLSCSQIYLNSAVINTPRAIAIDARGAIYVGSSGTDTIEKLTWTGSGTATRAISGSLIGPGVFSQNPTAITVIP